MKNALSASALLTLLMATTTSLPAADAPLPRSTPEAEGVSSQAIRDFVERVDQHINTLHSFMVVRHGHVVAEGW